MGPWMSGMTSVPPDPQPACFPEWHCASPRRPVPEISSGEDWRTRQPRMFIQRLLRVGILTQRHSRSTPILVWTAGKYFDGRSPGSGEAAVPNERMAFASFMNQKMPAVLQWRGREPEMLSPPRQLEHVSPLTEVACRGQSADCSLPPYLPVVARYEAPQTPATAARHSHRHLTGSVHTGFPHGQLP